jgi:GntR family transcriptional regulator, transcriptional repressor for pyruvate dehydrogenase complex
VSTPRGPGLSFDRVRPAYQQVADQLMERILDGSLAAGDRLPPEGDLAAAFGVSRSTVREALRVLASRDLVVTARGTAGGSFVAHAEAEQVSVFLETSIGLMSGSDDVTLDQMLEAREMVEVPASRLAAVRRGPDHLAQLHAAIATEQRVGGRGERFERNKHFHGIVLEASGNKLFTLVNEPVFRVLRARFSKPEMPPEYWEMVSADHAEITRLIEDQDQQGAATAMREHMRRIRPAYHAAPRG